MALLVVAPYTGAWIEIFSLKSASLALTVAPYTGAWIEIGQAQQWSIRPCVAPYTGAWIEINKGERQLSLIKSHPTRVRGLKFKDTAENIMAWLVAPYTGAWIEIRRNVAFI